ncbi:MAG: acyltransferase [Bacteroidetes bacterium]|nr:acyltransferase [Bacteroidota bacterium]
MKRISQIDGLRAVASLLVVSFHYINNQLTDSTSFLGKLFAKLFSFGWAGVDLFFVLSGFLIGGILITNKNKKNYFSTFYIRRFVRIIPNYYLLILLFIILCAIPAFKNTYFLRDSDTIPTWSYFTMFHNVFMAKLNHMGNTAMSVTWSIGIEEQFYLIIPFIIYFTNKKLLPYLLIAFILLANVFRWVYITPETPWIAAYVLLPCRMDAISLGVILAWINSTYSIEKFVEKNYKKILATMLFIVAICTVLFIIFKDIGVIRNTLGKKFNYQ